MANRYWVGGTDNWNTTAGTKWALTSGGAGGQAVPTSSDDVFFDASSGSGTVTVTSNAYSKNLNFSNFTGTFAGNITVECWGNLTFGSGMTLSHTGAMYLKGQSTALTVTSNGKTWGGSFWLYSDADNVTKYTLQDNLSVAGIFFFLRGEFDANDFDVTCNLFSSANSAPSDVFVRKLYMGSGTWYITRSTSGIAWNFTGQSTSYLIIYPETSTIRFSTTGANTKTFTSSGFTFNNLYIAENAQRLSISASNTWNNIYIEKNAEIGGGGTQTVNDIISYGTAGNLPLLDTDFSKSSGTVNVTYVEVIGSTAGGGATWNAIDSTDSGGNTGWNFISSASTGAFFNLLI